MTYGDAGLTYGDAGRVVGSARAFGSPPGPTNRPRSSTVFARLAVCNQAIGVLDSKATEAEEHERSLAGKVERVTRRERGGGRHLEGIVIGFIVALVAALVAAYLAFRFGWV